MAFPDNFGIKAPEFGNLFLPYTKFGHNPDIDVATTPEDIWDVGGLYPHPAAAAVTTAQSTSVADTLAGTGAQIIVIEGVLAPAATLGILNQTFTEVLEFISLSGTTPVVLANSYFRINKVYVFQVGSDASQTNLGDITIQHGATVLATIETGFGQTRQLIFTAPNFRDERVLGAAGDGFFGTDNWRFISFDASILRVAPAVTATLVGFFRIPTFGANGVFAGHQGWRMFEIHSLQSAGSSFIRGDRTMQVAGSKLGPLIPAGSDLRVAITFTSANSIGISVEVLLCFQRNPSVTAP